WHPGFVQRLLCKRCALRYSPTSGRRELAHPCARTCAPCSRSRLRCSARTREVARGMLLLEQTPRSATARRRSEAAARMAASRGPCQSAGGWRISPKGRAQEVRVLLDRYRDVPSSNPGSRTRTRRAGCPESDWLGVAFSLVTFSWPPKRK